MHKPEEGAYQFQVEDGILTGQVMGKTFLICT